jgi:hypothetical protein
MKIYYCQINSFMSRKIFSPSYPACIEGQYLTIGMVNCSLLPLKEGRMKGRQRLLSRLPQERRVISVSPGESEAPKKYLVGRDLRYASRSWPVRGWAYSVQTAHPKPEAYRLKEVKKDHLGI